MKRKLNPGDGEWQERRGYEKKVLFDEDELEQKGCRVQMNRMKPHTSIAPHFHERVTEVYHVLEGEGIIFISGTDYLLRPGDTLICRPGEVHGARNESDGVFRFIVFKTNSEDGDMHWTGK